MNRQLVIPDQWFDAFDSEFLSILHLTSHSCEKRQAGAKIDYALSCRMQSDKLNEIIILQCTATKSMETNTTYANEYEL